MTKGDVDTAFQQADHVVEGECHIGGQEHFYLETMSTLAVPKGEDGEMELYVSTQNPTFTQVNKLFHKQSFTVWGARLKPACLATESSHFIYFSIFHRQPKIRISADTEDQCRI